MRNPLKPRTGASDAEALVNELAKQRGLSYPFSLDKFAAGRRIQDADPQLQVGVVVALLHWLKQNHSPDYTENNWKLRSVLFELLKRKLPFSEADVLALLDYSIESRGNYWRGLPQMIKIVSAHLKANPLSDAIAGRLGKLIKAIEAEQTSAEDRRRVLRLKELKGDTEIEFPLMNGDVWAQAALADIHALSADKQTAWAELLLRCLGAAGAVPGKKWRQQVEMALAVLGAGEFRAAVLAWFPLVDRPRQNPRPGENGEMPLPVNADLLKGLAWLCSRYEDAEIARALTTLALSAYRRLPGRGPRAAKVGNACFWALGSMPGAEGMAQLSILKVKIKGNSAQKAIAAGLELAAMRTGITAEELEELSAPAYGLEEVGVRRGALGDVTAEIRVVGSDVELLWERSGKRLASAPKAVREQNPEEYAEIAQTVRDIRKMLPAQRERLDGLYLSQGRWPLAAWRARYLDHPLVGTIARRLIWKFSRGDRAESGIWHSGRIVGQDGKPLAWLDESATVELWHPLNVEVEVVLAWRNWLAEHEVQQPFKQAHREVYLLTDAERSTRVYSNRYAAHILRQHQFNALCAARGWKNSLRLMVDDEFPPAARLLPGWGLRAEYWVEGIGDQYGTDTNQTGTFLFLTTDQVRFYHLEAVENRAHAGGGGYHAPRWNGSAEPLPLEDIPPLVFSEIMRDVDMFVGVASLGNDPNWLDGGPEVRYRDYWNNYSFGELAESARTRKQVLEAVLPRLKIAARCKLTDKFLVVSGGLRTYKIHLGSGNILMEPNDKYLCIVPSHHGGENGREKLFLPFEGDRTLAIILSKAFLLADDTKITDPSITRQLKR